jgi:hypothetical protein
MPKLTRTVSRATATIWKERVAEWRASGETAKAFSESRGWSWHTLVWWGSRLGREARAAEAAARAATSASSVARAPAVSTSGRVSAARSGRPARAAPPAPVRFARVIRPTAAAAWRSAGPGAIVVEWIDAGIRITVEPRAERDAIARVIGLIAPRGRR